MNNGRLPFWMMALAGFLLFYVARRALGLDMQFAEFIEYLLAFAAGVLILFRA